MTYSDIVEIYNYIKGLQEVQKNTNILNGVLDGNVKFDSIDLSDILEEKLSPAFVYIFNQLNSSYISYVYEKQMLFVFLATVCEVAKNGVSNDIIKKLEEFSGIKLHNTKYYNILKKAFKQEKIRIVEGVKNKWQETIILESGIPKNLHSNIYKFFVIYWKWFRGIDIHIRHEALNKFLETGVLNRAYIPVINDYNELCRLYSVCYINRYTQRTFDTCVKLENVFNAIEKYQVELLSKNADIETIFKKINSELGFNIRSILRVDKWDSILLNYARDISFSGFYKIVQNLLPEEEIKLPNNNLKKAKDYNYKSMVGGVHWIKGNIYNVSYPGIPLSMFSKIPKDQVYENNNNIVFVSSNYFDVFVNGFSNSGREFIIDGFSYYSYYSKKTCDDIEILYDNGQSKLITGENTNTCKAWISKLWDYKAKKNIIGVFIKSLHIVSRNNPAKKISFEVLGVKKESTLNMHGRKTWEREMIPLEDGIQPIGSSIDIIVKKENEVFDSFSITLEDTYLFHKKTGRKINDNIDLSDGFYDESFLLFSKKEIKDLDDCLSDIYADFYVYELTIDLSVDSFLIDSKEYRILKPNNPYLVLEQYVFINENCCYDGFNRIRCRIENINELDLEDSFININNKTISLNENSLDDNYINNDVFSCFSGEIYISLYSHQKCISSKRIIVVPDISLKCIVPSINGGKALFRIKSDERIFFYDGDFVDEVESFLDVYNIDDKCYVSVSDDRDSILIEREIERNECIIFIKINNEEKCLSLHNIEKIDLKDLEKKCVLIKASCDINITIYVNNIENVLECKKGSNYFDIREFLLLDKTKNSIYFDKEENLGCIIYNTPEILDIHYYDDVENQKINFSFDYSGPINKKIIVRININDKQRIIEFKEDAINEIKTQLGFYIEYDELEAKNSITIKTKIDEGSFEEIFNKEISITNIKCNLNKYSKVNYLLDNMDIVNRNISTSFIRRQ